MANKVLVGEDLAGKYIPPFPAPDEMKSVAHFTFSQKEKAFGFFKATPLCGRGVLTATQGGLNFFFW